MATVTKKRLREFGPESNGTLMTPGEFDRAAFVQGWRLCRRLMSTPGSR